MVDKIYYSQTKKKHRTMQFVNKLSTITLLLMMTIFFTSASIAPKVSVEEAPPVEKTKVSKKAAKKQLRQQKKVNRLKVKLAKAKTEKQKTRLQKKITKTQNQEQDVQLLSILALIFAFIFPIVGLILAIIAQNRGGGLLADLAFWISIIFLILFVLGYVVIFRAR